MHHTTRQAAEVETLLKLLRQEYGEPKRGTPQPPLDELIGTILSQNTSDTNTARAFASLRDRFATWEEADLASVDEIADAIRVGGLANTKASTIKHVLREVKERTGAYDLRVLEGMATEQARDWLTSLRGVGPKTAACVLLFSMGRPVMPVDTHVHRVSQRLGLVPEGTSAERAHDLLEEIVPDAWMYDAHMLLIQHGRRTCKARMPRCDSCVLAPHCPSAFFWQRDTRKDDA